MTIFVTGGASVVEIDQLTFADNIDAQAGRCPRVYGRGESVRDWLFLPDPADALLTGFPRGRVAATFERGCRKCMRWYARNGEWCDRIHTGVYGGECRGLSVTV